MDPDEVNELGGGEIPLAFRMMENIPGIAASLGFATYRGSNTLMRGGFQDNRRALNIRGRTFGGPGKLGGFTRGGQLVQPNASAYYGSSARRANLAANAGTSRGKMAFGKGSRVNHLTARPRALSRYNSLAIFNASQNAAHYSPFQMVAKMGGGRAVKNEAFRKAVYGADATADSLKNEQVFQRGMVSMITAGRRTDILERKALGGSGRAAKKLATAQEQVRRLANMNNPLVATGTVRTPGAAVRAATSSSGLPVGMRGTAADRLAAARAAGHTAPATVSTTYKGFGAAGVDDALRGGNKVGLTGNLMASAGGTQGSRFVQGYFRGALGHMNAGGLTDDALRGAQKAVSHLGTALGEQGLKRSGAAVAERALEQGVFKTLGFKRTMQAAGTKTGAMVLGARTAAMAIPGLNLLATASLVYDLGKMGGELVKSGVNLAKDAVKSMKGSIDKPMFGMGYKDNEVAATSRARGVMAIQNSRLNARSMLGSEGSMMAAHFG
jgi:hypothetical protein